MKTKFIKGTNRQYSIREDGFVTSNYTKYKGKVQDRIKILSRKEKTNQEYKTLISTIRLNGKPRSVIIESLLYEYFNIQKCRQCNKNIKHKDRKWHCKKCDYKNHLTFVKRWKKNNTEKVKDISKKHSITRINSLKDSYIAGFFKGKTSLFDKYLLELKRNQLKLHRELKKQKQNDTN